MSKIKQHYRGKFVFNRNSYVFYRYAYSERQAWLRMCQEIAKKHGVSPSMVMGYFDGPEGSYKIEIETEFREED